jgi:hypothetical protein
MGSMDETSRAGEGTSRSATRPGRRELVAQQLARSDQHWTRAVTELREGLIGMAGELDDLERRVRDLESPPRDG